MKEPILGIWEQMASNLLEVHPNRCTCVRNKNACCMRCAEVCTSGAISFDGENLVLDAARCIGCGTCATACPTCALEAQNPSDQELSSACAQKLAQGDGATLELSCSSKVLCGARGGCGGDCGHGSPDTGGNDAAPCDVMCMGRLDESLLVELSLRGCKKIKLETGDCELCPHKSGGALAREVVQSAQQVLEAWGRTIEVEFSSQEGFDPDSASDASLLKERHAVQLEKPARPEHVNRQGTLSHHAPSRRIRLFKLLDMLGSPVAPSVQTRLWGEVSIDTDQCKSCRMCAVFCPTGALKMVGVIDGRLGVEHRPAQCVQCRLCESICPAQAIEVSACVSPAKFADGYFERIEMRELDWIPNRPDSIWRKTAADVGGNYTAF